MAAVKPEVEITCERLEKPKHFDRLSTMPDLVDVMVVTKQKWRVVCTWPECRVQPETEIATTSHGSQTLVLPKYSSSFY